MLSSYTAIVHKNQGKDIPIYGSVRIGNYVAHCLLFFPLTFVIGDGLSGDHLCGHYKNYSPNVARLSQTCNVTFNESNLAMPIPKNGRIAVCFVKSS